MERKTITNVEFIQAILKGTTADDLARSLGLTSASTLYTRRNKLIAAGVKVPEFKKTRNSPEQIDIDALNAMIEGAKGETK